VLDKVVREGQGGLLGPVGSHDEDAGEIRSWRR
jgi:hypothetical protein